MKAEQQYIDLFTQYEAMICQHSAEALTCQSFCRFRSAGISDP